MATALNIRIAAWLSGRRLAKPSNPGGGGGNDDGGGLLAALADLQGAGEVSSLSRPVLSSVLDSEVGGSILFDHGRYAGSSGGDGGGDGGEGANWICGGGGSKCWLGGGVVTCS